MTDAPEYARQEASLTIGSLLLAASPEAKRAQPDAASAANQRALRQAWTEARYGADTGTPAARAQRQWRFGMGEAVRMHLPEMLVSGFKAIAQAVAMARQQLAESQQQAQAGNKAVVEEKRHAADRRAYQRRGTRV